MNSEQTRVLEMLQEGTITVEQANELLKALEEPAPTANPSWSSQSAARPRGRPTGFTVNQLIELRAHGVTPQFVQEMRRLGFSTLSTRELIQLRDHGVTPDYVAEMREAGFDMLRLDELIQLRAHGVTPRFVAEMRDLGFEDLNLEKLMELRDMGVNPDYVREMEALGLAEEER